jgi:LCP family protein required for cell wall assembly
MKRARPALAALLSLVWPGLGQAYQGHPRRALVLAVPPLLIALSLGALALLLGPPVLVVHLLVPVYAAAAVLLILLLAGWWALAVIDSGRPHSGASAVVSVMAVAVIGLAGGWAASVVFSLYDAGQQIARPVETPQPTPAPSLAPGQPTPTSTPTGAPTPTPDPNARITVLFLGSDMGRGPEGQLTDTIQIASFDPRSGQIAMISVPRDTAQMPMYDGRTWDRKINELASYAAKHPDEFPDGAQTLELQLEYLIGIPIDYYAVVSFDGFRTVVDAVGGVEVTLDRPIADASYSRGPGQPRGFFMEPGDHHLDGSTALAYVRSRHGPGNSDYQRARRQQQVLLAMRQKINDPLVLANLPSIVEAASRMVRTNAPLERVPQIVSILQASTQAQAETYVLRPPQFAEVIPREEVGRVFMTRLKMDAVADLSIRLFGEESRYYRESR